MNHTTPFRVLTKSLLLTTALGGMSVGCGASSTNVSASATSATSAAVASPDLVAAQSAWAEAVSAAPSAEEGCFHASYPSMTWEAIDCAQAPTRFNIRPSLSSNGVHNNTVGNGNDYAAVSTGLTSKAVGTFPTVSGVKTETDSGTSNEYSIQLNSNFMSGTKACKGVSGCQSWSQFVYSSSEESAFIQDWLIGIGTCPSSAWNDDGSGDCYKNSAAVSVPKIAITSLSTFKMSGAATSSKDSLVFTAAGEAYSTSQADSVTNLSTAWNASEFNIIGDGGGSSAVFNKGSSITVKLALTDGSTSAPSCESKDGTTGETNDLTAGKCTTGSGSSPYIEFTEAR
jgi:hypothetical protein